MARSAVLAGRTLADVVTNLLSMCVLLVTGLIIGFTFDATIAEFLLGVVLLLVFGYAFSWVFALVGLLVSSPEAANSLGFIAVFPLTFISSAFVPVESMPGALQWFAEINPFTIVVDAIRSGTLDCAESMSRLADTLCAGFVGAVKVAASLGENDTIARRVDDLLMMWRGTDPVSVRMIEGATL